MVLARMGMPSNLRFRRPRDWLHLLAERLISELAGVWGSVQWCRQDSWKLAHFRIAPGTSARARPNRDERPDWQPVCVQAAIVGVVDLLRHQPVESRADFAGGFLQVDVESSWVILGR